MKKTLSIISFAGLIFAIGCAKLKSLTTINIDLPTYTNQIYLPSVYDTLTSHFPAGGVQISLPALPIVTNSQQYISTYNTTVKDITSISVKQATLQMVSPSGAYFDYLDSISIYMSATNLPTVLFASKTNIPKGQNILTLDVAADTALKSYFLKDTIYMQTNAHFNNVPPASSVVESKITFHMVANPLN